LEEADRIPGFNIESFACSPLRTESKIIGVLEAINPKSEGFEQESLVLLNAFGSLAGTAVRNAQLFEQIQATNLRYRELFEDNIDPIIITDFNGKMIESNRQAGRVTGYTPAQLQGKQIQDVHNLNLEKLGNDFSSLLSSDTITYESEIRTQEGWEIPVQVYVRRIEYYGANSIQWILRDITERVDLDSLRNDLIAMVYHDLRSPLANVTASLDILSTLQSGENEETAASLLNIAMRSSDRIQRLLNSLLDTYRLEAGQSIVNLKDVNPTTLIKEVVDIIQPTLESKSQTLLFNIQPNLSNVSVDPDMIRRVFVNLVENASKFSPVQAHIEMGALTKDGTIEFWIRDDGPGIPVEDQERVFDKFSRLKMSGSAKGMGLGLAFCRLAVTGHGGKIWVESTPGKGSCFYFSLPSKDENDPPGK
jgi:PAS domain S-box-containing protein